MMGFEQAPRALRATLVSAAAAVVLSALSAVGAPAWAAADANKAAMEELRTVKGIGPAMAERILDERKKGSFKDWADFIGRIKGIGEGNAAKFSGNGLTVNGAGYNGAAPAAAAPAGGKSARVEAGAPARAGEGAKSAKP